jgi:hypothetical protein
MRLLLAILLLLPLVGGCASPAPAYGPRSDEPQTIAAAHVFVTRPYRVIPEPDRFIQGALTTITEELIRDGYDWMGVADSEPDGEADLRDRLGELNARRPGTAALHFTFSEAPTLVGFGTAYTEIHCAVYEPSGRLLFEVDLELPTRRRLLDLLLPRLRPDVDGRAWAARVWRNELAAAFPRRCATTLAQGPEPMVRTSTDRGE